MPLRLAFKSFWNGIVSLWSTAGRSLFQSNHLWLINVVERVLQHRQHHQVSHWFANMAVRENKTALPHKVLFMHWTKKLKPQSDSDLLENIHWQELSLTNARYLEELTSAHLHAAWLLCSWWTRMPLLRLLTGQTANLCHCCSGSKHTGSNKQNREGSLHDRFAYSTNNWELAKL